MNPNPQSNRMALTVVAVVVGVLVVLVLIASLRKSQPETVEPTAVPREVVDARPTPRPTPPPMVDDADLEDYEIVEVMVTPIQADGSLLPTPTFDPEDQPRANHIQNFRNLRTLPPGFEIDGVVLTDQGFQLPPPAPGEEDIPRFGMIESPSFEMTFPANAISPIWLEEIPEGTNLFLEVAVSPDGENWGIWHPVEPDDDAEDIPHFFEDGRPNPHGGHTAGGVFFWGFRQFRHFRFRATLSSEATDSPTFSAFNIFYQDSTLGQGHLAELVGDDLQ